MRIYLDSCIVIYLIEGAGSLQTAVEAAIRENSVKAFCVSELVRLECKVGPMKRSQKKLLEEYDRFFENVVVLEMNKNVFETATSLRAAHSIKTPDALHLACAIYNQCDEFWTNDNHLTGISRKIRVRTLP
ncbi:MAG: type II toxin-antitoxin system VapC family toxin [Deltaproteobacteria bacterium]|nr:type II toxin-antitoxin system VapC family toxin [Deltaproteobacteria bacterium]